MVGRVVKSLIVKQHEFDINTSYYNSIHNKKNTLIWDEIKLFRASGVLMFLFNMMVL